MSNTTVFKRIDHSTAPFYIKAFIDGDKLNITLLQSPNAWITLPNNAINNLLLQFHLDLQTYNKKVLDYIGNTPPAITFVLNNDEFVIYHHINEHSKVRFFVSKLEAVSYNDCVESMLVGFYTENVSLKNELEVLKYEAKHTKDYETDFNQAFDEYVKRKEKEIDTLYSNFVEILNEKKLRCQHLTELLKNQGQSTSSISASAATSTTKKKVNIKRGKVQKAKSAAQNTKREIVSESDSDSNTSSQNYETDEEKDEHYSTNKRKYQAETENVIRKEGVKNKKEESYAIDDNFLEDSDMPELRVVHLKKQRSDSSNKNATPDMVPERDTSPEKGTAMASQNGSKIDDEKNNDTENSLSAVGARDSPSIEYNTQELLDMI